MRVTPASAHRSICRRAPSTPVSPTLAKLPLPPKVMVPRVSAETRRPLAPSCRCSMRAPYPAIYRPRVPLTAPTSTRPRRVLATVTAAQVVNVASTTIVAVALPDLGEELGASPTELQWVVDAFVLVFASLLIAGGVAGDRYGRRRALLAGLVVFAVGSLWCAVAPSVEWLLAGRVVQALGPPLTLPASLAIVTATFT